MTDFVAADLAREQSPQIYALCGKGFRSSLRVLRHGVAVSEMAVSELPGRPSAVWTVRGRHDEPYDRYIVVSFTNATLVLSIGETVEEVTDSGRAPARDGTRGPAPFLIYLGRVPLVSARASTSDHGLGGGLEARLLFPKSARAADPR